MAPEAGVTTARQGGRADQSGYHIVIVSGTHLCNNPRAFKEATALAGAGYRVTVLGGWFDVAAKRRDRALMEASRFCFVPAVDLTQGGMGTQFRRIVRKLAATVGQSGACENRWQLGSAYAGLRRIALRSRADLYIAHLELGIAVAPELRRAGYRVAADMEDWFSEDLLPEARRTRPLRLLRRLEGELLAGGAFTSCPSQAMSRALAQEYGCRPPAVIYNAFPWAERDDLDGLCKDRRDLGRRSIHWFSQTIGPGRGLEDLLAALPLVTHTAEIHLRGNPAAGLERWLADRVPQAWRDRVFVHAVVANEVLLSRIAEHDIGFAGEMKYCRSRDLTVTNKILQYLLAGLAVVASDTEGQREVAEQAGEAVLLYPSGQPEALAVQLNAFLGSPEWLRKAKAAALSAAKDTFCWERQEPVLLNNVCRAFAPSPTNQD